MVELHCRASQRILNPSDLAATLEDLWLTRLRYRHVDHYCITLTRTTAILQGITVPSGEPYYTTLRLVAEALE